MPSELLQTLAVWLNLALLGAIGLLFLVAILVRLRAGANQRVRERVRAAWRPILVQRLAGQPVPALPLRSGREWLEWIRLWNQFQATVRGEPRTYLIRLAEEMGLPGRLPRLLRRRGEPQLLGIVAAGNLRDAAFTAPLEALVAWPEPTVSISAAEALAKVDPDKALQHIRPRLLQRTDWNLPQVATVLLQLGQAPVCEHLTGMLSACPEDRLPGLLRLIGALRCSNTSESVWNVVLAHDDPDIVAPALNLLRDPQSEGVLYGHLLHDNWVVRMSAVACLGRVISAEHVDLLLPMLSDSNWWVRYRGAQAVANVLGNRTERIQALRDTQSDPFARDMLGQVVAEIQAA